MVRKTEYKFQAFWGNKVRINEIDPRFITKDLTSVKGVISFPYRLLRTIVSEGVYEIWRHSLGKNKRVYRPILMFGLPHSGTSISMRLFAYHPDIANKSEANTILQPIGYFDLENGNRVRTKNEATESEIARLHSRFSFYCSVKGKPRILNKCPDNAVRLDFLNAVFPDACFIHIIRDGRAAVQSMIRGLPAEWETEDRFKPWKERINPFPGTKPLNWRSLLRDNPIEQHALQWREVISYVLEMEKKLKIHYIKYEDLCKDPRSVLGEAYKFCGLRFSDEILSTLPEKLKNMNYKWRKVFNEDEIKLINEIQEPMLNRLGYDI